VNHNEALPFTIHTQIMSPGICDSTSIKSKKSP
jgi:hypothetical protein